MSLVLRAQTLQSRAAPDPAWRADSRAHLPAGFLDDFYLDQSQTSRRARIEDEPPLTGAAKIDALMGAIGEHLCHRWAPGTSPARTDRPERFLHNPWALERAYKQGFADAQDDHV